MKKTIIIFITALSLLLLLTGCSSDNTTSDDASSTSSNTNSTEIVSEQVSEEESKTVIEMGENYEYNGVVITLPKDYSASDVSGIVVAMSDGSSDNITMTFDKTSKFSDYNESAILISFKSVFGVNEIKDFTKGNANGLDYVTYSYQIESDGVKTNQVQYCVNAESGIVCFTFTYYSDTMPEAFTESMRSITKK